MTLTALVLLLSGPAVACMEMASFRKLFRDQHPEEPGAPEAVILYDGVEARERPYDAVSPVVHRYATGECVEVHDGNATGLLVSRSGARPGWVGRDSVYAFKWRGISYADFLSGRPLDGSGGDAPAAIELESRAFAERASRHPRRAVRVMGLRRLLGLSSGQEAIELWLRLQREPEAEVRAAANRVLAEKAPLPKDPRLATRIERAVRGEPREHLGDLAPLVALAHPRAESLIVDLLLRARREALALFWKHHEAIPRAGLLRLLAHESPEARAEVYREAYREVSAEDVAFLLDRFERETSEVRPQVAGLLGQVRKDSRVEALFRRLLLDRSADDGSRDVALRAILESSDSRDRVRELVGRKGEDSWLAHRLAHDWELAEAAALYGGEALFARLLAGLEVEPREEAVPSYDIRRERLSGFWSAERLERLPAERRGRLAAALARLEESARARQTRPLKPVRFAGGEEILEDRRGPFRSAAGLRPASPD